MYTSKYDLFAMTDAVKFIPTSDPTVKTCNSFPMVIRHVIDDIPVKILGACTSDGPVLLTVVRADIEDLDDGESALIEYDEELFTQLQTVFAEGYKNYRASNH